MQRLDWHDLTYFLALYRAETLAEAGRRMGCSDTTVARRVRALEGVLGRALFLRTADGRHGLTPAGRQVLRHAEAMERGAAGLATALGADGDDLAETVTVSAVPILSHRVLLPALPNLYAEHPKLTVELIPDARNVDLSKREADLAVRFSRPAKGGLKVKAVKLGTVGFAVFGAAGREGEALPWILYGDAYASLPQARWSALAQVREGADAAPVLVEDAETALEAVALGLGKACLPARVGRGDARLRVLAEYREGLPERDVWLLSHVDQARHPTIGAVKAWLAGILW